MIVEQADVTVIGAGVVGLAVASRLCAAGSEVVVVERHRSFGRETSSRNSEVIHAGLYYPSDSLKARLCVEGNAELYALCRRSGIPFRRLGKLVVAERAEDRSKLEQLLETGLRNGAPDLRFLSREETARLEPEITSSACLYSPSSGIVDTHALMKFFEQESQQGGATIAYGCEVSEIASTGSRLRVEVRDVDGDGMILESPVVVNAAGLSSGTVAAMAGIDIDAAGYRIRPCKGEYFRLPNRFRGRVSHLIYPTPGTVSLGIHVVLSLDGALRLGPNAFYVEREDYDVDPAHEDEFLDSARAYLPFLHEGDLTPDMAGIRPKLQGPGEPFRDFVISEEGARGIPGLVNLVGIESPGLTASPAIARYVEELIKSL